MTTSFEGLFVSMELVPLFGTQFTVYAPIIVLIVGVLTVLNVYARALKAVGIESEDAITGNCASCGKLDADDIELISIGKKLVMTHLHLVNGQGRTKRGSLGANKHKIVHASPLGLPDDSTEDVENPLYAERSDLSMAPRTSNSGYRTVELSGGDIFGRPNRVSDWVASDGWGSSSRKSKDSSEWGEASADGYGVALENSFSSRSAALPIKNVEESGPRHVKVEKYSGNTSVNTDNEPMKSYGGRYKR